MTLSKPMQEKIERDCREAHTTMKTFEFDVIPHYALQIEKLAEALEKITAYSHHGLKEKVLSEYKGWLKT